MLSKITGYKSPVVESTAASTSKNKAEKDVVTQVAQVAMAQKEDGSKDSRHPAPLLANVAQLKASEEPLKELDDIKKGAKVPSVPPFLEEVKSSEKASPVETIRNMKVVARKMTTKQVELLESILGEFNERLKVDMASRAIQSPEKETLIKSLRDQAIEFKQLKIVSFLKDHPFKEVLEDYYKVKALDGEALANKLEASQESSQEELFKEAKDHCMGILGGLIKLIEGCLQEAQRLAPMRRAIEAIQAANPGNVALGLFGKQPTEVTSSSAAPPVNTFSTKGGKGSAFKKLKVAAPPVVVPPAGLSFGDLKSKVPAPTPSEPSKKTTPAATLKADTSVVNPPAAPAKSLLVRISDVLKGAFASLMQFLTKWFPGVFKGKITVSNS